MSIILLYFDNIVLIVVLINIKSTMLKSAKLRRSFFQWEVCISLTEKIERRPSFRRDMRDGFGLFDFIKTVIYPPLLYIL